MDAVVGTYQNGYIKLDKEYSSNNPVKVIVTFLEDIQIQSEKGKDTKNNCCCIIHPLTKSNCSAIACHKQPCRVQKKKATKKQC